MTRTQYDMTIIGGGSGGLTAARLAASLGANVLLIDKERLGGDCLNYGCVPSKSLIHVARVLQQARDAATLGLLPAQLGVDMAKVAEYIQGVIRRVAENEHVYTEGVTVEFGNVSFNSATELTLNGECFTSRKTLVATGSHPLVPQIEGLEETGYVTNEHVFDLTRRPSSLLVVGGGPIGVELGQAFARLGSRVTIIEGLNLEAAGVTYTDKGIAVDAYLQTSTPNILAVGDVIGGYLFTHVAAYQAGVAVRNTLVPIGKKKVDYRVVPWCTFTEQEVAHVGLTPEEAEQRHKQVRIVKFPWAEIDRAQAEHATTGFIKLILAGEKDEIVGAHMIGARAGELLGEISLAMQRRLRLSDILATIHVYPTMSTGIQQAAFEAYLEGAAVKNHRKIVRTLLSLRGR